jgi:GNAT superfamily N-acetyltransferase
MIYYEEDGLIIRDLIDQDIPLINKQLKAQNWYEKTEVLEHRLKLSMDQKLISLVAYDQDEVAGMINLYPSIAKGPYQNVPFIEDLLVFEKFQRKHIASHLLDVIEHIAKTYSDQIALSVGLHVGYGHAHILYAKRGYIPSGCGVYYQNKIATPYHDVANDDDLLLFLSKKLKG